MGPAVIQEVRSFFETGVMDPDINHTHLCLIPKIERPFSMKDFRPIALCNVIYKVISKILVWRLKEVLPHTVAENQTAFISGRHISDNALLAHESFHSLRVNKRCASSYMAVKRQILVRLMTV